MPRRKQALAYSFSQLEENNSRTIEQYYSSRHCVVCRQVSDHGKGKRGWFLIPCPLFLIVPSQPLELCSSCIFKGAETLYTMKMRLNDAQKRFGSILEICQSCSGVLTPLSASVSNDASLGTATGYADHPCDSIDCPVFFQRQKMKRDVRVLSSYDTIIDRWF
jgi:DNA polymerase zeta